MWVLVRVNNNSASNILKKPTKQHNIHVFVVVPCVTFFCICHDHCVYIIIAYLNLILWLCFKIQIQIHIISVVDLYVCWKIEKVFACVISANSQLLWLMLQEFSKVLGMLFITNWLGITYFSFINSTWIHILFLQQYGSIS